MVSDNLERIREAKGITKSHVAKKVGLTLQGYSNMIRSGRIDSERLRAAAAAVGEEPAVFFDDELTNLVIESLGYTAEAGLRGVINHV